MALRQIVPYGVSVPVDGRLKLERSLGMGVQEGQRTLHSKASLKPNNGEVIVGSSPRVPVVIKSVPVIQDVPKTSEEAIGLVVPETAGIVLRRISRVKKEPDKLM